MFTLAELTLMRQALDVITITGKDAQYVAQLQLKIEQQFLDSTPPPTPPKTKIIAEGVNSTKSALKSK
jgi:hypothetical protein